MVCQTILKTLPNQPGIYKYFNEKNELIYVGKAKNIRKRVSSYFTKTFTGYKTHELVQRIERIEFTIVDSEQDAFLLENSLIKQFQPKFNINLKDDKTYPYLVIKNEPFPRIYLTRNKINDGSEYLGPFTSVGKVRELLSFIKEFIPLRTCKLNLTEQNIIKNKFKVCLEYHLGNCKGPCEGLQSKNDYLEGLQQIKQMIKGNLSPVIQRYKEEMNYYVSQLQFEKAEIIKNKLEGLENYQAKSVIVSKSFSNLDIFSILRENDIAYVNYLMVQNGTIVQTHTIILEIKLDETNEEILMLAIIELRRKFNSLSQEVVIPFPVDYEGNDFTITVPRAGDKKKLLELSEKNVNYFKNGLPDKSEYRKFNIKTVTGINDFASMKEVVSRRYIRLLKENSSLPQLIIIDGGKGQLNAAMEGIIEIGMDGKSTVVGLAKNEEEIFFPGDKESIKLPWNSESLKLIRRIRDEVHRFGISFHRNQRSRGTFINELEMIKGIGKNTADTLLKKFRSVKNIKELPKDQLTEIIGNSKAEIVYNYFNSNENEGDL